MLGVVLTPFEVLAQPIRRSILDRLRERPCLVGELAEQLRLTQPVTSKHLRVLRDAGLVTVRVDGPRRWYALRTTSTRWPTTRCPANSPTKEAPDDV